MPISKDLLRLFKSGKLPVDGEGNPVIKQTPTTETGLRNIENEIQRGKIQDRRDNSSNTLDPSDNSSNTSSYKK